MELVALFTQATALAALAVVVLHQILKWKFFPVAFANKYPVPTLIGLSVIASGFVAWQGGVVLHTWVDWLVEIALIAVTAAIVYITTIKNWTQLRAVEGTGGNNAA